MADDALQGGCLCGAVRYTIAPGFRFKPFACHCTDCQTRSGSAFAIQLAVMQTSLSVTGALNEGRYGLPSGAAATIFACGACQTVLYTTNDRRPGFANVRAGTLDDSATIVPQLHLWTASKQPWLVLPDGVPALSGQPQTPEEWMRYLGPNS